MSKINKNSFRIHTRGGTDQASRNQELLNPESVELHDFDLEDWMKFAFSFAKKVNFFSETNNSRPDGNWEEFFLEAKELELFVEQVNGENTGEIKPNLTLFACFLKLIDLSKQRLNGLTKTHLDFFYKRILQIESLPEEEDKTYLIFELAKNTDSYLAKEGLKVDGGKDAEGVKRIYEVTKELSVSKTKIAQIKNVYNESNLIGVLGKADEERYYVKAAPVANSLDGLGEILPEDEPTWYPFGYYTNKQTGSNTLHEELPDKMDLPDAKLGFAVASPVLKLNEGTRIIKLNFAFLNDVSSVFDLEGTNLQDHIDVYLTGEKAWLGPFRIADSAKFAEGKNLNFQVSLAPDEKPVVGYNKEVHFEDYGTENPVARFVINPNSAEGYAIYKELAEGNPLQSIKIEVEVDGVQTLKLESDNGNLNPDKPFYPFTTRPVDGSSFSFYNEEAFQKKCSKIGFTFKWKNTPDNFKSYYSAYDASFKSNVSSATVKNQLNIIDKNIQRSGILKEYMDFLVISKNDAGLFVYSGPDDVLAKINLAIDKAGILPYEEENASDSIVTSNDYFQAATYIYRKEAWVKLKDEVSLFNASLEEFTINVEDLSKLADLNKGPIRAKLNHSFLHELFPRIYALSLTSDDKTIPIPNEPYTPFAEEARLNYTASETIEINEKSETDFDERTIAFYHEHPFGQSEVHGFLKIKNADTSADIFTLPQYCLGGELYIGLENAKQMELVSLLFQVAEGTENPLAESFIGNQKVKWDILSNNVWRDIEDKFMVENSIDNFLKTGRVQFTIPAHATDQNTLLPSGLFWVRAKMLKRYDVVSRLYGIHTQATLVEFKDNGNETSHLKDGLPAGTLGKLVERVSQIKTIEQPYASFGGKPKEGDLKYYQRVSERLRHKNRAIRLSDYELIVLEKFPEIYKIKCLNHTCAKGFEAPGWVTLVVVPNTVNKQVFDIFQPRVSQATLNTIKSYLSNLTSMHIQLNVINPNYEEVKVDVKAKFKEGLDDNAYKVQLNEDIIRFLSPWAYSDTSKIDFGANFYKSSLIHFIEKLDYVDFIREVSIFKNGELTKNNCMPSSPKAILVSAKKHVVETATGCKGEETTDTTEICQL